MSSSGELVCVCFVIDIVSSVFYVFFSLLSVDVKTVLRFLACFLSLIVCLVVSTSAGACLERHVSRMTC